LNIWLSPEVAEAAIIAAAVAVPEAIVARSLVKTAAPIPARRVFLRFRRELFMPSLLELVGPTTYPATTRHLQRLHPQQADAVGILVRVGPQAAAAAVVVGVMAAL
jgi:hypothetical protein